MSNAEQKKLVPKLRFPEFWESGEWSVEIFNKVYEFKLTNSFSRDKLNNDSGRVKNIHYGDIHTKFSTLFDIKKEFVPFINESESLGKIKLECYCQETDMIFADASEDVDDIGKSIEIVNLNNEKLISGLHTLLARQIDGKLIKGFGGYLFKSDFIRKQIQRESQGAKVLGISKGRMALIDVPYPKNEEEQRKIADCLSSLDELISAHSDKLDKLKAHKKGLMQQLFPAEGQTVPKLRFPEFQGSGEWGEKVLSAIGEIITGNTPKTSDKNNYGADHPFVSPVDISEGRYIGITKTMLSTKGFSQTRKIKENSVLFVCIGSTIGKVAQNKLECATNQQINSIITFDDFLSDFIYFYLDFISLKIAEMAGNQAVPIINKSLFSSVLLRVPTYQEQQKIADCLSSLDELIKAQTEKIGALKSHKKGLMQQLFPSMD